jgi:hypothetical protein
MDCDRASNVTEPIGEAIGQANSLNRAVTEGQRFVSAEIPGNADVMDKSERGCCWKIAYLCSREFFFFFFFSFQISISI